MSTADRVDTRIPAGLCASCAHAQLVTSARGSVFYLCRLAASDARFRKYPTLPVRACPGYLVDAASAAKH